MRGTAPVLLWQLVIPVKPLAEAKSRLHVADAARRRMLALAFARHTVRTARACPVVAGILVVTADPVVAGAVREESAEVLAEGPVRGLNPALELALRHLCAKRPGTPTAVLTADLPALSPGELAAALSAAAPHARAVVPDAEGTGTVLLTARRPDALHPAFGPESCTVHAERGHVVLSESWPGLRRDVDTLEHLVELAGAPGGAPRHVDGQCVRPVSP